MQARAGSRKRRAEDFYYLWDVIFGFNVELERPFLDSKLSLNEDIVERDADVATKISSFFGELLAGCNNLILSTMIRVKHEHIEKVAWACNKRSLSVLMKKKLKELSPGGTEQYQILKAWDVVVLICGRRTRIRANHLPPSPPQRLLA